MKTTIKKKISTVCAAILMCSYSYSQFYCDSNPVDVHGDLSVSGNRIVDQNNAVVSFAGNSMFWSNTNFEAERFYNANVVSWLKQDWNTTIIRAAMGVELSGGYLNDPNANKERVKTIVDAAIAEGLYVIIDWHSHEAEHHRQEAIDFFKEMANLYGGHPNVIYEIYNEPIHVSWSNDVKPYAEAVISEIRAIDPDNLIIVGTPTWSQDVDAASNDPITSSTNIAYTLHFYAGTHRASLRSKAQTALNNGIALMVTEWGTVNADGNGNVDHNSTDEWMDFLEANDISHKNEGASILQPGSSSNGNWSDSSLTESGLKVKNIVENWTEYCDEEPILGNNTPPTLPIADYVSIPSRIEAEDYSDHFGTQIEDTADVDGLENVGYIDTDDSLTYNINVPNSGTYLIDFRVASRTRGTSFDIYQGNSIIGNISSNATGGWQTWETVSESVSLSQGNQTIRLVATGTGWNINWLEFSEEQRDNEVIEEEVEEPIEEEIITEVPEEETGNTNSNGCDNIQVIGSCDTASKSLNNNQFNNIDESTNNNAFGITSYPNPFSNTISVTVDNVNQIVGSLQLVNLSGKIIALGQGMNINNLENVSNGMYLLQILDVDNQIIATKKVIKK